MVNTFSWITVIWKLSGDVFRILPFNWKRTIVQKKKKKCCFTQWACRAAINNPDPEPTLFFDKVKNVNMNYSLNSFHFLCYDFLFRDLLKIVCACMLSHHQFVFHFPLLYYWMLCYVLKFPWILSFDLFLIIIYAVFPTILALGFLLFSVHVLPFGDAFTRKTLYFCHHVNDS